MKRTLFVKDGCYGCAILKPHAEKYEIKVVDIESVDGMAQAAFFETIDTPVPYMVIETESATVVQTDFETLKFYVGIGDA